MIIFHLFSDLVLANANAGASIKDTFRSSLDKHLRSGRASQLGSLVGHTVGRHGFAITRELQRELLLPLSLDATVGCDTHISLAQTVLVHSERIHLLGQDDQGSLGGFTNLFVGVFGLQNNQD